MTQATTRSRARFARETDAGGRVVRQVSRFRDRVTRHSDVTHDSVNPTGIVPEGPELDLTQPHDRA